MIKIKPTDIKRKVTGISKLLSRPFSLDCLLVTFSKRHSYAVSQDWDNLSINKCKLQCPPSSPEMSSFNTSLCKANKRTKMGKQLVCYDHCLAYNQYHQFVCVFYGIYLLSLILTWRRIYLSAMCLYNGSSIGTSRNSPSMNNDNRKTFEMKSSCYFFYAICESFLHQNIILHSVV